MTTYKLIADNFVLYDAAGVQLYPAVVTPPPVTGPAPPAPVVRVLPTTPNIQAVINAAAGGSVVFAAGNYPTLSLNGKSGLTLWAEGVVTGLAFNMAALTNWTVRGVAPGVGFIFTRKLAADNANVFFVGNCIFNGIPDGGWNGGSISMNAASGGYVVNNDFNSCMGTVLGMYNLDNITFDGNHFDDCWQPFSVQGNTDGTRGRNLIWRRNTFTRVHRAGIELGPSSGAGQFFDGLIVDNNWFDDFDHTDTAQGTMLPISLVGQASKNTVVTNNFIRKGTRPNSQTWAPSIEFTGTGECKNNLIWGWEVAGYTYQSGWNLHDNSFWQTGGFINNGSGSGTMGPENVLSSAPVTPPRPARIAW